MTTYTAITNGEIDQDSPVTQPLLTALRDNPIAIAEGASGAPIVAAGWHPYDMVEVGDGNDGEFYDFSVDGGVTTFVTPDFEDGYEYAVRLEGMSVSTNDLTLKIEGYLETSAAYDTQQTLTGAVSSNGTLDGLLVFKSVRRSLYLHRVEKEYLVSDVVGTITDEGLLTNLLTSDATAQKITRLRIGTTFTTDAGKAYLYRRRNYTTD